jgi:hypothetical protein
MVAPSGGVGVPVVFEAASVLRMLHASPRLVGGNDIAAAILKAAAARNTSQGGVIVDDLSYPLGAAGGSVAMLVCFFVSLVVMCVASCCCRGRCGSKRSGALMILALSVLALVGFLISISGETQLGRGAVDAKVALDDMENFLDTLAPLLRPGIAYLNTTVDAMNATQQACAPTLAAAGAASEDLGLSMIVSARDAVNQIVEGVLPEASAQLKQAVAASGIKSLFAQVLPHVSEVQIAYAVGVSLLSLVTLVFALTTAWEAFENTPGRESALAGALDKCSGGLLYSVGVVALLVLWVAIAVLAAATTVGADFCVPSPLDTAVQIVSRLPADQACGQPSLPEELQYVCFYRSCQGANPLEAIQVNATQAVGNVTSQLGAAVDGAIASLDTLRAQYQQANNGSDPANFDNCRASLLAVKTQVAKGNDVLAKVLQDLLDFFSCRHVRTLLTSLIEDAVCNEVVAGGGTAWITLCLACSSLGAAMILHRVHNFKGGAADQRDERRRERQELKVAEVVPVAYAQDDAGADNINK